MLRFSILLAQASPLDSVLAPEMPTKTSSFSMQDGLLIVGIVFGLAVILFLWVYLTRKKSHGHLETSANVHYRDRDQNESAEPPARRGKVRKRRKVHPENLPRNPTLGETGGLPPVRSEEPNERGAS